MGFSSTAITQPNINAEAIKKISIQLPGKNEQETVLGLLESYLLKIRVLEKHVFALQNHLAKIKKSILSKAFRGELVQQDPNDEPASLMLEQIKKENQPKETKKEKVLAAR